MEHVCKLAADLEVQCVLGTSPVYSNKSHTVVGYSDIDLGMGHYDGPLPSCQFRTAVLASVIVEYRAMILFVKLRPHVCIYR